MMEIKLDGAGGQGKDRAPWHYGKTLQDDFRRACEERMELAPYVFSQLNTSEDNGVLMKPLAYEYPGDSNTYHIWNEYLFGNSFLVAPVTKPGESTRSVYLPNGVWYDWHAPTNSYYGGKTYRFALSQDHIPVFVKQNAVFITGKNWLKGNAVEWNKRDRPEIMINAFPGKKDFTNSFTCIDRFSNDSLKQITVSQKGNRIDIRVPALGCEGKVVLYNVVPKGHVTVNGKKIRARIDKEKRTAEVEVAQDLKHDVVVER